MTEMAAPPVLPTLPSSLVASLIRQSGRRMASTLAGATLSSPSTKYVYSTRLKLYMYVIKRKEEVGEGLLHTLFLCIMY